MTSLFNAPLRPINVGLEGFYQSLVAQGIEPVDVDWRPPLEDYVDLEQTRDSVNIEEANTEAVRRICEGRPMLVGMGIARDVIPGFHPNGLGQLLIMHSGPPITWERMCGPTRGAIIGALLYEGLATAPEAAEMLAASGEVEFAPCHHFHAVGPMAGVISPSMPVFIVRNETYGNVAYATQNEGLGKVLRYGANSPEVIERLRWIERVLAPVVARALEAHGPLDMKNIIAQVLQMGDEGHNRNRAGTSLVLRELAPFLVMLDESRETVRDVIRFINGNDHFFLNLSMPSAKATVDPAAGIEGSSIVVTMARNGTEFGIRVSGLGDRWFTGPASMVEGLYLPGYSAKDAAPDIGDSVITETAGIGGFAMAAAPAIVKFVGGSPADAVNTTLRMYEITAAESETYQIPALDFRGTPTGVDLLKIIETGILPAINTGIAHKEPGVGMVGAGLVKPPVKCFADAFAAFVQKYGR
jgi:hypothetical protein